MSSQVVLTLPDNLYRSAERLAAGARQPMQNVLTEVLSQALATWDPDERSLSSLRDDEVLALCDSQMSLEQSRRLGKLLDRQQAGVLTVQERPELWTLLRIYELGQLRKAEALAEAVGRGLRPPGDLKT